jgi:hypothetical protein
MSFPSLNPLSRFAADSPVDHRDSPKQTADQCLIPGRQRKAIRRNDISLSIFGGQFHSSGRLRAIFSKIPMSRQFETPELAGLARPPDFELKGELSIQ